MKVPSPSCQSPIEPESAYRTQDTEAAASMEKQMVAAHSNGGRAGLGLPPVAILACEESTKMRIARRSSKG